MSKQNSGALTDLDTPHFSYWQALYASFFSPELYVDVGKRWKRLSLGYLLLAMFVILLPLSLRVMYIMNQNLERELFEPIRNIPTLYLQNGKVSLDKPMPYLIKDSSGAVKAIVDTTGKITSITSEYPALTFLITRDSLFYRIPPDPPVFSSVANPVNTGTPEQFKLPADMTEVFNGADWLNSSGVRALKFTVLFSLYPCLAMAFFGLYLSLLLAFAMMVQFVSYIFLKFTVTYAQAFRLLMVASTPQLVLLTLLILFNAVFTGMGAVLLVVIALYCSFGLLSLKRVSNRLVRL
ncbi:DUF1189 family protein [Legionella sp. CNM-4043-24]|uniref:DUF1189 family protein n=1 Tax=Legionella sp. CNM-4043-24 TaxID=3421646 RepID=UPI00403AF0BE